MRDSWFAKMFLAAALVGALDAVSAVSRPDSPLLADRSAYDALLGAYVKNGLVDYEGLLAERANLESFIRSLASVSSDSLAAAPKDELLAFWINATNAITLLTVIEKYPLPKEGLGAIRGAWDEIERDIAGRKMTLNRIVREELIGRLQEPRVHFVLAAASLGGPALRSRSYAPATIEQDLEEAARQFVNDPRRNRIDMTTTTVYLSQMFQWFDADFVSKYAPPEWLEKRLGRKMGACLNFIALYLPPDLQRFARSGEYEIKFIEYDWRLNDAKTAAKPIAAKSVGR